MMPRPVKKFVPYAEACRIVRKAGITTQLEFQAWKERPASVPANPYLFYGKGWVSWGDFLGTTRIFASYDEACQIVRKAGITSETQFKRWKDRPDSVPAYLGRTYKGKGWVSSGEFFGTGRIADLLKRDHLFVSYEEACQIVREAGITSEPNFRAWKERPDSMPGHPQVVYEGKGWMSYGDFFGTGTIANQVKSLSFVSYEEACQIVREAGITTQPKFNKWKDRPDSVPTHPQVVYEGKGWVSYGEFFGTGQISYSLRLFLSYEDAANYVRSKGVRSKSEFEQLDLPSNIPRIPWTYYPEWVSWKEFLGTGFVSYEEARRITREAGIITVASFQAWRERPDFVPAQPNVIYKGKGWVSYGEFFGTGAQFRVPVNRAAAKGKYGAAIAKTNEVLRLIDEAELTRNEIARTTGISIGSLYRILQGTKYEPEPKFFVSYDAARKIVREAGITSMQKLGAWKERPDSVPFHPERVYEGKGWVSYGDFFGTEVLVKQFLSYDQAREWIAGMGMTSVLWKHFRNLPDFPDFLPKVPASTYRYKGWQGWKDFSGGNRKGGFLHNVRFVHMAVQRHGTMFNYDHLPKRIPHSEPVEVSCPHHDMFKVYPLYHLRGGGCPKCDGTFGLT